MHGRQGILDSRPRREPLVVTLLLFAYPALLGCSGWRARQMVHALFVLGVIGFTVDRWPRRHVRDPQTRDAPSWWMWLALVGFAASLALTAAHGMLPPTDPRIADSVLAGAAWLLARRAERRSGAFWLGCIAGAVAAAVQSILEVWIGGAARARGYHFYVTWGALGAMLGGIPLVARPPGWERGWRRAAIATGAVAGAVTAVLSGSRDVWLACTAVAVGCRATGGGRAAWRAAGIGALLLLATIVMPIGVERWRMAVSDLGQYASGHADTSLGVRFALWRDALLAWRGHPWLGMGAEGFHRWLARLAIARGPTLVASAYHAHNDLLNALACQGIIGMTALCALYAAAWCAFAARRRRAAQGDGLALASARAGQALVLFYAVMGLADTMLAHDLTLTWCATAIMLLLGLSAPLASATAAQRPRPWRQPRECGMTPCP